MNLGVKMLSVAVLIALALPVILVNGCGDVLTGGACGGCPNSTAPYGSTIVSSEELGIPSSFGSCYPTITFQVLDSAGDPMSDICVEIYTNGSIALHSGPPDCSNVVFAPSSAIITRTNSAGVISVEFATPACSTGETFFVQATSCSVSAIVSTPACL